MEDILTEAKTLAEAGVRELNVVAQDTTRYGEDLYGKLMLPELLRGLCRIDGLVWVRLLYCYPDRVTDELIGVIAGEPKIVKYIDLPVQHIDDDVLRRMNRRGGARQIEELLEELRQRIPGVVVRTTLLAGLPGETEEAFARLCGFVRAQRFERLGCFAYSAEEDTPAALMSDQIDERQKKRRAERIMEIQMEIAEDFSRSLQGKTMTVLCEGFDEETRRYVGRSEMDAPDIDTRVYFSSGRAVQPGEFVRVTVTSAEGYDLTGREEGGGSF
jgi:ribosomal protein S12 methylthiotransferase